MTELYGLGYRDGGYAPLEEVAGPARAATSTPYLSVLVDWVNDVNPDAGLPLPVWTDMTSRVRAGDGAGWVRGRQRVVDRIEAGTASVVFLDPDGDLDPENVDSPFYPYVLPNRRIRITSATDSPYEAFVTGQSETGGTDVVGGGSGKLHQPGFDGFIQSFRYTYPAGGATGFVEVRAVDWLGALARSRFSYSMTGHLTDPLGDPLFEKTTYAVYGLNRIALVLDELPFASERGTNLGRLDYPDQPDYPRSRQVAIEDYVDAAPLDVIGGVVDVDGGAFFAQRDGALEYRGPTDQYIPLEERMTFGPGKESVHDVEFGYDESLIYPVVRITSQFGVSTFVDEASKARNFSLPLELSAPFGSGTDVAARGEELLLKFSEARRFVARLDLSTSRTDWDLVLGLELWDKVLVEVPVPGGTVRQVSLVEGIEVRTPSRREWVVTLWLSPAPFINLLAEEASDFETGFAGWTAETNCTVDRNNRYATHGAWSMLLDPTVAGDVSALSDAVEVEARVPYYAGVKVVLPVPTATPSARLELEWRDAADVFLSSLIGDTQVVPVGFGLPVLALSVSGRSPSAARFARLRVRGYDVDEVGTGGIGSSAGGMYADQAVLQRTN